MKLYRFFKELQIHFKNCRVQRSSPLSKVKKATIAPKKSTLSAKERDEPPKGHTPFEQTKHYVIQNRQGNRRLAKIYKDKIMLKAIIAFIEQTKLNSLEITLDILLSKAITIFNQHCREADENEITYSDDILCSPKTSTLITKDQRQIILELLAIVIVYMIKSEKHTLSLDKFYKTLLSPDTPDNIKTAKEAFEMLQKWPSTSSCQYLDKLLGRGISFPFTGGERMKVGKNRLTKKKDSNKIEVTIKQPSPYELLSYQTISEWRHLRSMIRDNLDLTTASSGQINHYLSLSIKKVIKNAFQSRSTLVQDFSPGAAKYLTTRLYPEKTNLVGCDPCGGWGDRLTGWLATNQMGELHINDTNPKLVEIYPQMVEALYPEREKKVVVTSYKAEEFYEQLDIKFNSDIIITSPPYFAKEAYEGENASHNQYQTAQDWINKFLFPFSKQMSLLAKENSYACILINDINYYDAAQKV